MSAVKSISELCHQVSKAIQELPVNNPTMYLSKIKRLENQVIELELRLLDDKMDPIEVREELKHIKQRARGLQFSPAALAVMKQTPAAKDASAQGLPAAGDEAFEEVSATKAPVKKLDVGSLALMSELLTLMTTEEPSTNKSAFNKPISRDDATNNANVKQAAHDTATNERNVNEGTSTRDMVVQLAAEVKMLSRQTNDMMGYIPPSFNFIKKQMESLEKQLEMTKQELAEEKQKSESLEKKVQEMYQWYKTQQ